MTHGKVGTIIYPTEDSNPLNMPKHGWCNPKILLETKMFYEKNGNYYFK